MQPAQTARLRRLSAAAAYAVVVGLVVTVLAYLVRSKFDPLVRFDEARILSATSFTRDHPRFLDALLFWQAISQPLAAYLVVAVPACLWVWLRKHLTTRAWWAFLTMMVGWMLALGLKALVQRARPVVDDPVSQSAGYSFPSGHATNAAIIATALTLLFWPLLSRAGRRAAIAASVLWVTITCLDRVFLGVHYPTDVIGGVLLGCGLVLASYAGYVGWTPRSPEPSGDHPDPTVDRRADPSPTETPPRGTDMGFLTRYDDDPTAPRVRDAARDALVRAILPAVGLWLVIVAFGWMLVDGPLQGLAKAEEKVNDRVAAGRTPTWNTLTEYFSLIGSTMVIIAVAVIVSAAVWWATKRWWMAVVPLLAIFMQSIVFGTASVVVGRDRPTVKMLDSSPPTTSYPSGHESASTALYVSFLLLSLRVRNPALRWTLVGLCSLMPILVFYGRLYRGMHHLTDLAAGITNGVVCALLAWNYLRREPRSASHTDADAAVHTRA